MSPHQPLDVRRSAPCVTAFLFPVQHHVLIAQCSVTAFDPTRTGGDASLRGGKIGTEAPAILTGPFEFIVDVKYVRREIRSLTDQDREMFFNAVSVMQRVPTSVGQGIYGGNYYSKDYMTRLHLYYGMFLASAAIDRFTPCYDVYNLGVA